MESDIIQPENTPVAQLRNLGPKTAQWLHEIGISTRQELIKTGPIMAYKILKHQRKDVSIVLLFALYGAIHDYHWNEIPAGIKEQLKKEASMSMDVITDPDAS